MIDVTSLSVWIVTYNRPQAINLAVRDFLASTPDTVPINVISNHSQLELDSGLSPRIKVWMNTLRPNESWGYLSRNWNQCFYLGLKDHEWVLCSQDDVRVKPGWFELIQQHPTYDFYTAPFFDMMFLTNRSAFRKVGWFDERFLCVDLQDNDYLRRVYQQLGPQRICVEDRHGWLRGGKPVGMINAIGLSKLWLHGPDTGYEQPADRPRGTEKIHFRLNDAHRYRKWGTTQHENAQELLLKQRLEEIDWYPWFTEYLFKQAHEPYPLERYLGKTWRPPWWQRLTHRLRTSVLGLWHLVR